MWGGPEAGKGRPMGQEVREQGWSGVVIEEAGEVGLGTRTGFPVTAIQEAIYLFTAD